MFNKKRLAFDLESFQLMAFLADVMRDSLGGPRVCPSKTLFFGDRIILFSLESNKEAIKLLFE
jgi:hypothetical protein